MIIIDHKIMAVAQSIGNEYQLFSRWKNHRKIIIRSLFYIQNYAKLFPVPVFWEMWNFICSYTT